PTRAVDAGVDGFASSDDIDDEIREVFLEELEEESANLGELLVSWRTAPENMEQLRSIRRVFHTLKGSGRLVGAKTLGEFSWKIESMLNRVLDGSRLASPAVVAVVDHAYDALPQLHAALAGTGSISADLAGIAAAAGRVAAREEASYVAPPPEPAVEAAAPVADIDSEVQAPASAEAVEPESAVEPEAGIPLEAPFEEAGIPASVDAVLLEILGTEVAGHLATIELWLAASEQQPQPADDRLQRAIHTLNGALAMTEVPVITDITAPTEAYVKRLLAAGQNASAEGVAGIAAVSAAVSRTLKALQSSAPRIPEF